MGKLTAVVAAKITKLGLTPDGDGLYLQINPLRAGGISRSWVVRYSGADGRRREAGLGRFPDVGVAAARKKAKEVRAAAALGRDPLQERDVARAEAEAEAAKLVTFKDCAERYVEAHEATWTNAKHAWQWTNTLWSSPVLVESRSRVRRRV